MKPAIFALFALLISCSDPGVDSTPDNGGIVDAAADFASRLDSAGGPDVSVSTDTATPLPDTGANDAGVADTSTPPAIGSAGCGNENPPLGPLQMNVQGAMGDYIVSLPANYDPATPYPLGFGFHGANRTHENCQAGDCIGFQAVMENEAILVYMKSFSTNWLQQPERDQNAAFFEQVLDHMLANACVDEKTVFVAGTSSGATFSNIVACRYGDRLLATIPVAGGLPERDNCVGTLATMVVHGVDDPHVPFNLGEEARDFYLARNGCMMTAVPPVAELHARITAAGEIYECADYQGCNAGLPVRWCEHSEGGYDDSTHGWPSFGGAEIWAFVQSLR